MKSDFGFKAIKIADILILTIITYQAVDQNEIALQIITMCCPVILPFITHIVNFCLSVSALPDLWKISIVTPLNKRCLSVGKGVARLLENFYGHTIT